MKTKHLKFEQGSLVERARSDQEAFAQLYRNNYDAVFRYCVHRLFDREKAKDAVSIVFLKAVEKFGHFRGSDSQFLSWLYRIAGNVVCDMFRDQFRREKLLKHSSETVGQTGDIQAQVELADEAAELKRAIFSLRPKYQTIITLCYFEYLNSQQIAEVLGCSAGSVRSYLARAIEELKTNLSANRQEVRYE